MLIFPSLCDQNKSLHRTPSQKTIATQLSIPISSSNLASSTTPNADSTAAAQYAAGLPSITTTSPNQVPDEHQIASSEAIMAHVNQVVAS